MMLEKNIRPIAPPLAARRPEPRLAHGQHWFDDYAWIRAENWRDVLRDPANLPAPIRELLEAENAYADHVLAPTRALQRELAREMRARMKEDDSEPPQSDGPFAYYTRFRHGGQHRIYCRRPREGGKEEVLVDSDAHAKGKAFYQLRAARHSPDHTRIAWSADEKGSELHTIHVRDIEAGIVLDRAVENATGDVVWTRDSNAFLYISLDEEHRPWKVMLHRIGSPIEEDAEIFEESDPAWFLTISATRLGRRAIISVHGHDASEAHLVDLDRPLDKPRLVAPRRAGLRYDVMDHGDELFIRANCRGAYDFMILRTPCATPDMAHWRTYVTHRPGQLIEAAMLFAHYLARLVREDNIPRIVVRDLRTDEEHSIAFAAETYFLGFESAFEFDTPLLRFAFSSMTTPKEIYDHDMGTRARTLRKRQMAPRNYDPDNYVTRRVFADAPDGERVPISLLYRKDTPIDSTAPLLVYGYGAYGHALDASFSTNRLSLVDRGFVYAIAHARGGTEKGWLWYENGKLAHKANTFGDFIAATRHLVERGFAAPDKVVAHGGSAGGMLMGVIANRAPQLYAGIIADVPFVDVLNTMLDPSLPLTPPEWLEWGNPIADAEAFAAIRAYSPYDNIAAHHVPAILALAGLTDPRVTYWEPAKWVARLRATMTGGGPILLRTHMEAGHGGSSGRFDKLDDVARAYAFAIACVEGRVGGRDFAFAR
jgi:oligopeptidase B